MQQERAYISMFWKTDDHGKTIIDQWGKPTDIFSLCGFGQYSNFYRAFKKYYHMSPMTFLKKMNYEEKNE